MNERVYQPKVEVLPPPDTAGPKALLTRVSDVPRRPIEWLWPQRFALGKVSLIPGDPGGGKSHVALDMAARITRAELWPDGSGHAPEGDVVIMTAEDDVADTVRPRLEAAGADLARVHILEGVELTDEKSGNKVKRSVSIADIKAIKNAIEETPDVRLLIVDPISAFMGTRVDSHKNAEVRQILAPLQELAQENGVAIVCITHLNKGTGSKALYRATGSLAFVAAARAAWLITADEQDPERRLFLPMKNNLGPCNSGLAYRLVPWLADAAYMRVDWEPDPVSLTADEAMDPGQGEARLEWEHARDWLLELLADGRMDSPAIYKMGGKEKYSEKLLRKAAGKIGVRMHKQGYGEGSTTFWELP